MNFPHYIPPRGVFGGFAGFCPLHFSDFCGTITKIGYCGLLQCRRKPNFLGVFGVKKSKFRVWLVLTLLWLGLIFLHSSMPADASNAESSGLLAVVQTVLPWMTHAMLRKVAHFVEFFVLGICLTGAFRYAGRFILLKPLAFGLLTALCDETLQLFVRGRSGRISDIWLDLFGVVCGTLITWLIFKLRKH